MSIITPKSPLPQTPHYPKHTAVQEEEEKIPEVNLGSNEVETVENPFGQAEGAATEIAENPAEEANISLAPGQEVHGELAIDVVDIVPPIEAVDEIPEGAKVYEGVTLVGDPVVADALVESIVTPDTAPAKRFPAVNFDDVTPRAEIVLNTATSHAETVEQPTEEQTSSKEVVVEQPAVAPGTYHYFNCKMPNGSEKVYKRNPASKNYEAEIVALRKSLQAQGVEIVSEEVK